MSYNVRQTWFASKAKWAIDAVLSDTPNKFAYQQTRVCPVTTPLVSMSVSAAATQAEEAELKNIRASRGQTGSVSADGSQEGQGKIHLSFC